MTHLCYKLKIAPAHKPQIYRVLEIDGNRTFEDFGGLVITIVDEADEVVTERLRMIPALLQQMWIRMLEKDLLMAGYEEIYLLRRLEEAGLVEVDEKGYTWGGI